MAEAILIEITDVQTYRKISNLSEQGRFDSYVMEVQRTNLRNLLGQSLYYAFMASDRVSGIYKDLLDGKEYTYDSETIQYYGLKPVLSYWYLALATREGLLFHSKVGAVEFVDNPQQHFQESKDRFTIASDYSATAQEYANDVIRFLNEHSTDYPLWDSDTEKSTTQFTTFRVS